ncbi:YbgS-like family protein [Pluralibacter gergoviae]|uniref:YbgS-like family protein n=1 Tax=Pluralibacter gergoviae TaxID=61647 RepID=A0A089PVG9_PLUGE|nr:YbgS-like family protein [Pluralibacter gergoviae]AIR02254.1 hypothetical protein LG71_21145 [Pluralibacter gergoviae]AVR03455.1 hypothetical protein A8H26_12580 [Pluralibacter gergoviae]EKT9640097.1 YbgS-like family protein [Pluralibacter gergoviae]EKV0913551.1 YbgS-like family protein [Pluralibacter gergoviae]EKV0928190.1 YbgS-like family protein [Pluralibacter gergoviae]
MKMNPLATLFLTAALTTLSGAALAANTGQANAAADAGQVAPDAHQNIAPNGVDGKDVNTGPGSSMNPTSEVADPKSKDDIHKNSMCKDGKCPDMNKKVQSGNGTSDVDRKTDGTTN